MNGLLSYGRYINPHRYYVGDWKDGKYHGQGTAVWINGTTYVGAWEDYKKHGQGKLTKEDGTV